MVLYQYKTVPLALEYSGGVHRRLRLATKAMAYHLFLLHLVLLQQLQPPYRLSRPTIVSNQSLKCTGSLQSSAKTDRLQSFRQQDSSMLIVIIIITHPSLTRAQVELS